MNALTWRFATMTGRLMKGMHVVKPHKVLVEDCFRDEDRILDLGGGGEAVIGQLRGAQVTAIDLRQEELDEAPEGPIKVLGDARDLPFPDASFDAVTSFYFLMYVFAAERKTIFKEAFRVLRPGGTVHVWDARIPEVGAHAEKTLVIPLQAALPDRTIRTLYGVRWEGRSMSSESIAKLADEIGFRIEEANEKNGAFSFVLRR